MILNLESGWLIVLLARNWVLGQARFPPISHPWSQAWHHLKMLRYLKLSFTSAKVKGSAICSSSVSTIHYISLKIHLWNKEFLYGSLLLFIIWKFFGLHNFMKTCLCCQEMKEVIYTLLVILKICILCSPPLRTCPGRWRAPSWWRGRARGWWTSSHCSRTRAWGARCPASAGVCWQGSGSWWAGCRVLDNWDTASQHQVTLICK